jgi:mRNA-degrading endonuclease RelE of RelBE toxin-antitoxin system
LALKTSLTESAINDLNKLPKEIHLKFFDQVERLLKNPAYPSLRNEKLSGREEWVFSITMNYRAAYIRTDEEILIVAVGTHKDVLGN